MVKKSMRATVVFLLITFSFALLGQGASVCLAVPYSHIVQIDATLSISSDGTASCLGLIRPQSGSTKSSIAVKLKQLVGSVWITKATWTGSGNGYAGVSVKGTKKTDPGYSYKVVITGTVFDLNGNALETVSKETPVKKY